MQALIREGVFKAVVDYTPHEVTDVLWAGAADAPRPAV